MIYTIARTGEIYTPLPQCQLFQLAAIKNGSIIPYYKTYRLCMETFNFHMQFCLDVGRDCITVHLHVLLEA